MQKDVLIKKNQNQKTFRDREDIRQWYLRGKKRIGLVEGGVGEQELGWRQVGSRKKNKAW